MPLWRKVHSFLCFPAWLWIHLVSFLMGVKMVSEINYGEEDGNVRPHDK